MSDNTNVHRVVGNLLVGTSHFFVDTLNNQVGINTSSPSASLDIASGDLKVGSGITIGNNGTITAANFSGNGSGLNGINSDSGSWVNGNNSNVHLATSTDKVGVGTNSPQQNLHVHESGSGQVVIAVTNDTTGSGNNDGIHFGIDSSEQGFVWHKQNTALLFATNNAERMCIDNAGNVGIGASAPACALDIAGEDVMIRGNTPSLNFSEGTNGMDGSFRIHYDGANNSDHNNFLAIQYGTNFADTSLHCTLDGRVGCGTSNPEGRLHISTASGDPNSTGEALIIGGPTNCSGNTNLRLGCHNDYAWIQSHCSEPLCLNPDGNNVGVGINNPSAGFHVQTGTSDEVTDFKVGSSGIITLTRNHSASPFIDTNMSSGNPQIRMGWGHSDPKVFLGSLSGTPSLTFRYLYSNENNSGTNTLGKLVLHRSHRSGVGDQVGISCIRRANTWDDQADMEFYVTNGGNGRQTAMVINSTGSTNGARVGIGTTSPGAILEVISTTEIPRLRGDSGRSLFMGSNYTHVNSTGFSETNIVYAWDGYPGVVLMNNNNGEYRIHAQGGSYDVLCRTDGGFAPFTGLHETYLPFDEDDRGKIVYSTGNYASELKDGNVDGVICDYLTVKDACPVVKICAIENDKRVIGVLSTRHRRTQIKEISKEEYELVTGDEKYAYEKKDGADVYIGEINTDEFSRGYYNAVGEGSIWVCNKNGNFENGDYITSSTVAGYGQKQNDDLLHNYTVAKITTDCDFSEIWVTTKKHKKTREGYLFDENKEPVYENILDAEGNTRTHLKFKIRYLLPDGTQISEEEYTTRALADEKVYVAALVGCTYHCG